MGWIKLDRSIRSHWLWEAKPFSPAQAWLDLLMEAAHTTGPRSWKGSYLIQHRGEVFTSMVALAAKWGWDRKKVARFLRALERDHMVTIGDLPKGTLITIENYTKFQGKRTAGGTAEGQQTPQQMTQQKDTIKEGKEDKENKEQPKGCYRTTTTMQVPTRDEVRVYCMERGNNIDADEFVDYYTGNGWMVGKNKMKDWKAAVRIWERKGTKQKKKPRNEVLEMMKGGLFNE